MGLTLPQLAAAGVAFALFAHEVGLVPHPGHASGDAHKVERLLAYGGSLLFTLGGMVLLGLMDSRGTGRAETRLAVAYALAGALTVLFLAFYPFGEATILSLVKGEAVVLWWPELATLGASLRRGDGVPDPFFRRELLLSSFDRDLTVLLKGGVAIWDLLFHLLAGVTVALGVIMAGPLLTFGFLVLPPIAVRPLVSRMAPYFIAASVAGAAIAVAGFVVCYRVRSSPWPHHGGPGLRAGARRPRRGLAPGEGSSVMRAWVVLRASFRLHAAGAALELGPELVMVSRIPLLQHNPRGLFRAKSKGCQIATSSRGYRANCSSSRLADDKNPPS